MNVFRRQVNLRAKQTQNINLHFQVTKDWGRAGVMRILYVLRSFEMKAVGEVEFAIYK